MDAWLDLHHARRLPKPLRPFVGSWPRLTLGRLTPTIRRREHSDGTYGEPRQRGKRRRRVVGQDRNKESDDSDPPAPVRHIGASPVIAGSCGNRHLLAGACSGQPPRIVIL